MPCVNLIDPTSQVSRFATLGQGIFIGGNAVVEPHAVIKDFVSLWGLNDIGHIATIGENSIIQRAACVNASLGKNVYVGLGSWVFYDHNNEPLSVGDNAVIDTCLHVARNVLADEWVQLDRNAVRVYRAAKPSN